MRILELDEKKWESLIREEDGEEQRHQVSHGDHAELVTIPIHISNRQEFHSIQTPVGYSIESTEPLYQCRNRGK